MKICSANLYYNVASTIEAPAVFLERMPLLREVPAALASAGHEVSVVQLYPTEAAFTLEGVDYHFVRPKLLDKGWGRVESWANGQAWTRHSPAISAVRKVLSLKPEVAHFHRLTLSTALYLLQMLRGGDGPAIVGQYHGGRLASGWLEHRLQVGGLNQVQKALFPRMKTAERFLDDGLLQESQIVVVADRSTRLTMTSRPEARRESGMEGSPVFLWYDGLEADRDPMTALLGFEKLLASWSKARLYLYYSNDEMLTQLRAYVIANPELAGHIQFRSQASGQSTESIFNSADFLLQSDRSATKGHALLEAMACGVIPVVSDLPPYRQLLDNGRCGFLFPPGDAEAMAKQLLTISPEKIAGRAALVHDWFEAAYSYEAMAGLLLDIYAEAIGQWQIQKSALQEPVAEGSG